MNDNQLRELLEKHKLILENPFWVFDNDESYSKQIIQHYKLNASGLKYISTEGGALATLWASLGTTVVITALIYGYKELVRYADKKVSEWIVKQYIICALILSEEEDLIGAIEILAFDLTCKSIMRYHQIATKRLDDPTTFDVIKGLCKQIKDDGKINVFRIDTRDYIEKRKSDYILPRLNTRSIAFTANMLFIFDKIDSREFKNLIKRYTFGSIDKIRELKSPDNHDLQVHVYDLIDNYDDMRIFNNYFNEKYKLFNGLIED